MGFLRRLIFRVLVAILTFWLANRFIEGVEFQGRLENLILVGTSLGLANLFLRPILNFLTLPLRILTFGLFSLVLGMFLIWLIDYFFVELKISGLRPLFFTTLLFCLLNWLIK